MIVLARTWQHRWRTLPGIVAIATASMFSHAEDLSFKDDVLPGLQYHCVNCHQSYDRAAYLVLEEKHAYAQLVNVPSYGLPRMKRVEPGKPEESYLWLKGTGKHIEAGGKGWMMPMLTGLRGEFKDAIYNWIKQGAKNN